MRSKCIFLVNTTCSFLQMCQHWRIMLFEYNISIKFPDNSAVQNLFGGGRHLWSQTCDCCFDSRSRCLIEDLSQVWLWTIETWSFVNKSNILLADFHMLSFRFIIEVMRNYIARSSLLLDSTVMIWWILSSDTFKLRDLSFNDTVLSTFSICSVLSVIVSATAVLDLTLQVLSTIILSCL